MPQLIHLPSNTSGLFHFENNLTNSGSGTCNLVNAGEINVSYLDPKFGTYGLRVRTGVASTCYVVDNSAFFSMGSAWTIDFWIKLISQDIPNNGTAGIVLYNNSSIYAVYFKNDGLGNVRITCNGSDMSTTTDWSLWTHVAAVHYTSPWTALYINGIKETESIAGDGVAVATALRVGHAESVEIDYYLDELRISQGIRWAGNFTPPTVAYDN